MRGTEYNKKRLADRKTFLFAVKGNYVINLASFFSGPHIDILFKLEGEKKKLKINTNLSEEHDL